MGNGEWGMGNGEWGLADLIWVQCHLLLCVFGDCIINFGRYKGSRQYDALCAIVGRLYHKVTKLIIINL